MKSTDIEDSSSENNRDESSLETTKQESGLTTDETVDSKNTSFVMTDSELPEDKQTSKNAQSLEENIIDEKSSEKQKAASGTSVFSKGYVFLCVLFLAVLLTLFFAFRWAKTYISDLDIDSQEQSKQHTITQQKIKNLEESLTLLSQKYDQSQKQVSALKQDTLNQKKEMQARLRAAEERLQAQNRRLLSLSTTTREDWLLAEAEYLLKLANQRVTIEKAPENAIALLEETDNILRDLADPDLYSVRQVLLKDISSLKLIDKIDQEGLYLNLFALAQQVDSLPVQPEYASDRTQNKKTDKLDPSEFNEKSTESISDSLLEKVGSSFSHFISSVKGSFNVVDYNETAMAMVSPQTSRYVKQNLRLMIERAQLALLREQPLIYQSSLNQAVVWLEQYFPRSEQRQVFIQEINTYSNKNIIRDMPQITGSLDLLGAYIDELHQLQGNSKNPLNTPQVEQLNVPDEGGQ